MTLLYIYIIGIPIMMLFFYLKDPDDYDCVVYFCLSVVWPVLLPAVLLASFTQR